MAAAPRPPKKLSAPAVSVLKIKIIELQGKIGRATASKKKATATLYEKELHFLLRHRERFDELTALAGWKFQPDVLRELFYLALVDYTSGAGGTVEWWTKFKRKGELKEGCGTYINALERPLDRSSDDYGTREEAAALRERRVIDLRITIKNLELLYLRTQELNPLSQCRANLRAVLSLYGVHHFRALFQASRGDSSGSSDEEAPNPLSRPFYASAFRAAETRSGSDASDRKDSESPFSLNSDGESVSSAR